MIFFGGILGPGESVASSFLDASDLPVTGGAFLSHLCLTRMSGCRERTNDHN